jgi:hypothetical protein
VDYDLQVVKVKTHGVFRNWFRNTESTGLWTGTV